MDGFNPGCSGGGAGGCGGGGGGCEMDDEGGCEVCAMWREVASWNHKSDDGKKQFLVVASDGFRDSLHIPREVGGHLRNMIPESDHVILEAPDGRTYPVEVSWEVGQAVLRSGWHEFVNANHIGEDYCIWFVYRGDSIFKVHIFDPSGDQKSSSCSLSPSGTFGAVPPRAPCDHHVLNEQMVPDPGHVQTSNDIVYTTLPGCCLTKAQDEKVLEIAHTMKPEIPLHVATMNKRNVSLKDSCVHIPLQLVLDRFNDKNTKATIQLKAPDQNIYSVGASKHDDDQIVLDSEWGSFVASHHIQEKDLLIFRSMEQLRLEVLILDPSGHAKTSSCFGMGNSSSSQEMSGDSVHIVDPPPPTLIELSSSDDDDDIVRGGTSESCRVQKRVTHSSAKARKMASTSSPSTKSGYKACKTRDRAPVKLGVGSEPLSNNLEGPSQRPYILTRGTSLPLQVEKKVEDLVQAIRSEVPVFVKVMTIYTVDGIGNLSCEMVFCMEYASTCLPDKTQTLFLELEGKKTRWQTTLDIRIERSLRRICKGWREFVRDNGLQVGDVCLFQLAKRSTRNIRMKVYLIRKSEIEM